MCIPRWRELNSRNYCINFNQILLSDQIQQVLVVVASRWEGRGRVCFHRLPCFVRQSIWWRTTSQPKTARCRRWGRKRSSSGWTSIKTASCRKTSSYAVVLATRGCSSCSPAPAAEHRRSTCRTRLTTPNDSRHTLSSQSRRRFAVHLRIMLLQVTRT